MKMRIRDGLRRLFILMAAFLLAFSMPIAVFAAGSKARVVDDGDLLSSNEEQALLAKVNEISERQQCDVVIVTVPTLAGKDSETFADDYFVQNGYGIGSRRDGILLMVCMEERDYAISTTGFGIDAFTDYGVGYIQERFLPELSNQYFYTAFDTFADLCDEFLTQARNGNPYDVNNEVGKEPFKPTVGLFGGTGAVSLALGHLFSYGSASSKKASLKSVAKQTRAGHYMTDFNLTKKEDLYVRSHTTSSTVTKSSETRSGGGGSSTHVGSSGMSHGGAHGKF